MALVVEMCVEVRLSGFACSATMGCAAASHVDDSDSILGASSVVVKSRRKSGDESCVKESNIAVLQSELGTPVS